MSKRIILGVKVDERTKAAQQIQSLLSRNGCLIRTRLGLHEVTADACAADALMLLDLVGAPAEVKALETALKALAGVTVKKMVF